MPAAKKSSASTNLHAFLGTDEARVAEAALQLSRQLVPEGDEFGLEIVNGQADNSDQAAQIVGRTIEALQTLPFFGGNKTVWLQAANFLGDTVTGRSQATLSAVEALQAVIEPGLPPDVNFILSATDIDKRRTFYKRLSKIARVEVFDRVDISREGWETQVMGQVSDRARELGLTFRGEALERFVLMAGADTRQWRSELQKLSLYLGERREATVDDVRAIVASTHTGVVWEIGDALATRNLPLTLELIDQQFRAGENAIGLLLGGIVPRVRQLLQARDLIERHRLDRRASYRAFEGAINRLPAGETAHLSRKKDGGISCYPLYLAAQQCGKFSAAELREALHACLEANLRLVTTGLDPKLVLSQLVAGILGRERRAGGRAA
ncbi:MAG: DNA polymerase III subunit delta [Verrucomicrobiae bacterium]|nr:DNA polymerase III subunit delta [Verrucomicrobiae bacterium]